MPDCTRCRCPLPDAKWLEHPSLEHCVKALGKKVNPEPEPSAPSGWSLYQPTKNHCPACGARVYVNALHLCTHHSA